MTLAETNINTLIGLANTLVVAVSAVMVARLRKSAREENVVRTNTAKSVESIAQIVNGDRERMLKQLDELQRENALRVVPIDNALFQRQLQGLQRENENLKAAAMVDDARRAKLSRDAARLNDLVRQANNLQT